MKNRLHHTLVATAATAVLAAAPLVATAKDEAPKAANVITMYVAGHGGSSLTKEMNELHGKMEQQGWRFADMEVHTENGDTEGFWVTYTK